MKRVLTTSLVLAGLLWAGAVASQDDTVLNPPKFVLAWGKKGKADGEIQSPIGIAINKADEIYVGEFHNDRVQKFTAEGKWLASFPVAKQPGGIAVDGQNRLYVAPMLLHKICAYDSTGKLAREWGKKGDGDGEFNEPGGIAIAADGTIYVVDQCNHRVQRFSPDGKFLGKWGEHGSKAGQFGGKGKPKSRLSGPHFLAFDAKGNLWTTEGAEGRIQQFTADGKALAAWGSNSSAPGGFGGREKKKTSNALPGPIGIAVDRKGNVWVSATNDWVQQFTPQGKLLRRFGGSGDKPGQFHIPHAMAFDSQGFLYVVDASNQRVQKFAP